MKPTFAAAATERGKSRLADQAAGRNRFLAEKSRHFDAIWRNSMQFGGSDVRLTSVQGDFNSSADVSLIDLFSRVSANPRIGASLVVSPKRAQLLGPELGPVGTAEAPPDARFLGAGIGADTFDGAAMARKINRLAARTVETLTKPGRHADGGGLYLSISSDGRRRWVFLFTWNGKLREAGLGSAAKGSVTLKAARDKAAEGRMLVADGADPIAHWSKPDAEAIPTFGEIADSYIAAHEGSWRNDKHAAQWKMTLTTYCATIRKLPADGVDTEAVLSVLQPLWGRAPETASRLRGRIEAVLDAAKAKGHIGRNEANPARWRGHLDKLLPRPSKLTRGHHAAMPYSEVPAFIVAIRSRKAMAALALEFCILTATRSSETLQARWSEIDLAGNIWTIPAARMKAGREHRVPLSARAVAILKQMKEAAFGDYVFPGRRPGRPLSSMALDMFLRRLQSEFTTHGFRSSFRDWAANETNFPRELAEQSLAHVIGDKAEQAYRRSDALERRRELMDAWARFCEGAAGANVVALKRSA